MDTERNYLQEAGTMLNGSSRMLPEMAHLRALEEAHQSEVIRIAFEYNELTQRILRRN